MAIFSRITAGLVIASLVATPITALDSTAEGHIVARPLRHPQARAHRPHHGALSRRGTDTKKKVCSAKKAKADADVKVEAKVDDTKKDQPKDDGDDKPKPKPQPQDNDNDDGGNSGGGNGGSGKAGLAWNDGPSVDMGPWLGTGKVTWSYSWSPWPACKGSHCPEYVPMLWSEKQLGPWQQMVEGKSWKNVLGFNEPDQSGQSSMSVQDAIKLWRAHVQPVKARHGSPAVTTSPHGRQWLRDFVNQCDNCDIDFYCIHYYGLDADDFIATVKSVHADHPDKPIWVTEWAAHNYGSNQGNQANLGEIKDFMRKTQAFLDATPWVERYAWFACLTEMPGNFNALNRCATPGGQINDLGRQYIAW